MKTLTPLMIHANKGDTDCGQGIIAHNASDEEFSADLSHALNKRVDRLKDNTIDLAIRSIEARQFLTEHVNNIHAEWLDFLKLSKTMMEEIRQCKVTMGIESKQLLTICSDTRKFFLNDDHELEIKRLREFVELAERLRRLKDDGTLDILADTILKLA